MQGSLARVFERAPRPERQRVAIVLNDSARAVTDRVVDTIRQQVGEEALFISRSLEQSKFIARRIVNGGYDVVLCGGGDGTFTRCVSDVMALRPARPPAFGALKLGTGNAISDALGADRATRGDGLQRELRQAHDADARIALPLVRVEDSLAPFAGVGLDTLILEDYGKLRDTLDGSPLRRVGGGPTGYALAIATRSLWRYLLERRPELVIRNEGAPAQPIDLRGMPAGAPVPRGAVIYRGPVTLAAASTVPFYGFGARIFPQASLRNDRFQLRVADIAASKMLLYLPQLLRGELEHDRVWDYSCTAISFELERPTPLQIGGDLVGNRTHVHFGLEAVTGVPGSRGVASAPAPAPRPLPAAALD